MERRSTACLWLHGQWRLIFFSSVFFFCITVRCSVGEGWRSLNLAGTYSLVDSLG